MGQSQQADEGVVLCELGVDLRHEQPRESLVRLSQRPTVSELRTQQQRIAQNQRHKNNSKFRGSMHRDLGRVVPLRRRRRTRIEQCRAVFATSGLDRVWVRCVGRLRFCGLRGRGGGCRDVCLLQHERCVRERNDPNLDFDSGRSVTWRGCTHRSAARVSRPAALASVRTNGRGYVFATPTNKNKTNKQSSIMRSIDERCTGDQH